MNKLLQMIKFYETSRRKEKTYSCNDMGIKIIPNDNFKLIPLK